MNFFEFVYFLALIALLKCARSMQLFENKESFDVINLLAQIQRNQKSLHNLIIQEKDLYFTKRQEFFTFAKTTINSDDWVKESNVSLACTSQLTLFLEALLKRQLWAIQGISTILKSKI